MTAEISVDDRAGNAGPMASDLVQVTVRFITIMQRYSGEGRREVRMELPPKPDEALAQIIEAFQIPWEGGVEAQARVFVNGIAYGSFVASGQWLKGGDVIAFIPISGGG
jgi:molybdopterin converting factor small subunit